ncbi:MAG: alpha/beta hydrolase [Alphaproteobacteria bacterium]|nr:alpha/beta hydrolase [Alphaproteobacteria bacterium]
MAIRRGFVDIDEGQMHFRYGGKDRKAPPLIVLNVAPGTSLGIVPLIEKIEDKRPVYAIDLPGTGDSVTPRPANPTLPQFADMLLRTATALGFERFDLYGNRVGAHTSIEMAIAAPKRIRKHILDGLFIFPWPKDKVKWDQPYDEPPVEKMRDWYTPLIAFDGHGTQFQKTWTFIRDTSLYWPWFERDAAHARTVGLPSADELHDKTLEVLKAARTQHLVVRASFSQDWRARCGDLAKLGLPTLADKNTVPFVPHATLKKTGRYDSYATSADKAAAMAAEINAYLEA